MGFAYKAMRMARKMGASPEMLRAYRAESLIFRQNAGRYAKSAAEYVQKNKYVSKAVSGSLTHGLPILAGAAQWAAIGGTVGGVRRVFGDDKASIMGGMRTGALAGGFGVAGGLAGMKFGMSRLASMGKNAGMRDVGMAAGATLAGSWGGLYAGYRVGNSMAQKRRARTGGRG